MQVRIKERYLSSTKLSSYYNRPRKLKVGAALKSQNIRWLLWSFETFFPSKVFSMRKEIHDFQIKIFISRYRKTSYIELTLFSPCESWSLRTRWSFRKFCFPKKKICQKGLSIFLWATSGAIVPKITVCFIFYSFELVTLFRTVEEASKRLF